MVRILLELCSIHKWVLSALYLPARESKNTGNNSFISAVLHFTDTYSLKSNIMAHSFL